MGKYLDFYCSDNNKELKKIVDQIIMKNFGWIPQKDYDDFYSIASEVVWDCEKKFDCDKVKTKKFKSFVSTCIHYKIKQRLTYMNRDKRTMKDENGNPICEMSIDATIGDDEKTTLGDTFKSEFDLESAISQNIMCGYSEKMESFLSDLTPLQRNIAELVMQDLSQEEIKARLNITDKQYRDAWSIISSYEKKRILYKDNENVEDNKMNMMNPMNSMEDIAETYKNTSYSIDSISKQLHKKRIRDDHILQRYSGQWKGFAKSELVSDILRGKSLTQIIISEEIKNGVRMQWLIDGKQRCTTLDEYLHDGFAISKNVKNYNIRYQTTKVDEDGNEVLNDEGFPVVDFQTFDIRGKRFSQLPEELRDIFRDRQIPVLYNMNCTKKDIADDIARFNRSRPMNKSQNGWLGLDEYFAEFVGNIAKMQFFQPEFKGSAYTNGNHTAGDIRRIIVESIMVSDFIEDYGKEFDKMCEFLSNEAGDSNFTEFYALIERLTSVSNENVAELFNKKDSFLWLGLFSRFVKFGLSDEKFIEFLTAFSKNQSLHTKNVDGITYKDLCFDKETGKSRSTKDKSIVVAKIELLEKLMVEYLDICENDISNTDKEIEAEDINVLDFVRGNVNSDATEEDVALYSDMLDDLTLEVNNDTKLLDLCNRPSLIALVGYACENDIDLDEWLVDYFATHTKYELNQKSNYLHMKEDLLAYLREGLVA